VKESSIVVQARVWTPSSTPKHSFIAEISKKAEEEFLYYAGSRGAGAPSAPLAASVPACAWNF
jgi:hypothetical protein